MVGRTINNCKASVRIDSIRFVLLFAAVSSLLTLTTCQDGPSPLTAEVPLHLEDHLDAADITGSEVPNDVPEAVEWRFDEPQPDWKPAVPFNPNVEPAALTRTEDALRVTLTEGTKRRDESDPGGGLSIDVPDWRHEDWAYAVVRARTSEQVGQIELGFNRREGSGTEADRPYPFDLRGDRTFIVRDGSVQTYLLRADWSVGIRKDPWRQLGLWFWADEPASIDILSIALTPKEADYTGAPVGARSEVRGRVHRSALYAHTPGSIEYQVRIPDGARFDVGLGVLRDDAPVTFRVTAKPEGERTVSLFEETYTDRERWGQRSVDLSGLAGETVTLALSTEAERAGTVALWGAPTLTGARASGRTNVIFYVIDGGAADYMSVYGYNRRTTPNIERLAAEGRRLRAGLQQFLLDEALDRLLHDVASEQRHGRVVELERRGTGPGSNNGRAHAPRRLPDGSLYRQPERRDPEQPPARGRSLSRGLGGLRLRT